MNSDQILGLIFAITLINFLGLIVIGLRLGSRDRNTAKYDERLAILEANMRNMPTHSDMNALRDRIAGIDGNVRGVVERITAQTEMLRTIQNHLMEGD